jgi:Iap family predicted aminopeptidase
MWPSSGWCITKNAYIHSKCSDHRAISIIAHTVKIVARILRRRIERKTAKFEGTLEGRIE